MSPINLHKLTSNLNKFDNILYILPFSGPSFRTSRESTIVYKKSFRLKKTMAVGSTKTRIIEGDKKSIRSTVSSFDQKALVDNGGVSLHQTASQLHTLLNHLSKWIVAASFSAFIMVRHDDGVGLWGAMGCVSNYILSITLKQMLKQERPLSEVTSAGPGMPSSHAQSIFFTHVFMILSAVERVGVNGVTTVLGVLFLALGLYFSWLRVLLRYHTTSQVVVGTIVGSIFSVLWFWTWMTFIHDAYISNLWVQIVLIVGVACYYLGFISYVGWHLVKN